MNPPALGQPVALGGVGVTPDFWRDRRVFLTGHTGFKGGWLALWLARLGAMVTGYALDPPTVPNLFTVARVGEGLRHVCGDVRDLPALLRAITDARPEVVFHLAAQPLVREGYRDPVGTYATNVMGTVHLLEAVRQTPAVRAVVLVTSDKCYHNREWLWGYREDEPMGGHDPYSNSKGCAELVTAAWRDSFFGPGGAPVALASARAGNVIGGGDWATDRLVPDLLRACTAGEPLLIRSPGAIRPWQHVLEPLAGYLLLAERLVGDGAAVTGAWNFGPAEDDARPVQWIVEQMLAAWAAEGGTPVPWTLDPGPKPHEAQYLKLDCAKARTLLGWRPRWPLAEALRRIAAWEQARLRGADMRAWCLAEIADYAGLGAT